MNIDKMRRTLERSREVAEQDERRRWLASLTPEHRAKHEGFLAYGICGECIAAGMEAVSRTLARISERREARRDA